MSREPHSVRQQVSLAPVYLLSNPSVIQNDESKYQTLASLWLAMFHLAKQLRHSIPGTSCLINISVRDKRALSRPVLVVWTVFASVSYGETKCHPFERLLTIYLDVR